MSYNAAAARVRCEFTRLDCLQSETPPDDLVQRARAKLEAVKRTGEIAFYYLYETRLNESWQALRDAADEPEERRAQITLGAGSPALVGVKVEKSTQEKAVAALTVEAPKDAIAQWRWEWFKLTVTRRLREAGIKETVNGAQVFSAFMRARSGERVHALPLAAPPASPAAGKAYSVVANKQRHEIGVVIRNVKELRHKANREAMLALIAQAVKQMSEGGVEYAVLKKDFFAALQSALDGPEGLGLELPLMLLAAVGKPRAADGAPGRAAPAAHYPGAGRLNFDVSADKMEARIAGFDPAFYGEFQVNIEWIQNELRRCLLAEPIAEDVVKSLSEAIVKAADLNGLVACRGRSGVGGKEPFLHHSFKDAAARVAGNLDEDDLDMREMQQRMTVKAGQLVAEVRYLTPPAPGRTVYGDDVPGPASDDLVIAVGDGIAQREPGRFYATSDGIPVVEEAAISLTKALVHPGDVNLRSGNIRFDGSAEIKGSIDSGAVVEVSGDLVIYGSVRGGFVRAHGSITVHSGITTGPAGRIQARGDIIAEFVENSNVICGGSLKVAKALLNSQVFVGGIIEMTTKGSTIGGGRIFCRESLVAENLGFRRGAITTLNVGLDWHAARAIDIRKRRLENLVKRSQEDRLALRELVQKKQAQTTQKHQEMKDRLQDRLTRLRVLCEKLEAYVVRATATLSYNAEARILVKEQLAANINVTVGGQPVAVVHDVANVAILPKRKRGTFIVPLEELLAEEQAQRAGGDGGKKAG